MLGLFCEKNMAIQTANLGAAPSGAGGDTFRSAATKFNENFTNNAHAASRLVGTQAGNVMEVGAFGLGGWSDMRGMGPISPAYVGYKGIFSGFIEGVQVGLNFLSGSLLAIGQAPGVAGYTGINNIVISSGSFFVQSMSSNGLDWLSYEVKSTKNTTVDSNGFIKAASPIVKLFAEKIELNEEAKQQDPLFEKLDIGHYLIKNTLGFSELGWYIEMPKDANGNVLVAVQYEQLEDQTIEVKTFAKKFDEETGDIVPNLEKPRDIPSGRWIHIRLQEMPEPELVLPESNTPASFQPTGISQAVSEMMNGTEQ